MAGTHFYIIETIPDTFQINQFGKVVCSIFNLLLIWSSLNLKHRGGLTEIASCEPLWRSTTNSYQNKYRNLTCKLFDVGCENYSKVEQDAVQFTQLQNLKAEDVWKLSLLSFQAALFKRWQFFWEAASGILWASLNKYGFAWGKKYLWILHTYFAICQFKENANCVNSADLVNLETLKSLQIPRPTLRSCTCPTFARLACSVNKTSRL